MPPTFDKSHIDISARVHSRVYQADRQNRGGGSAPRIRAEHGERLLSEMRGAFAQADEYRPVDARLEPAEGVYLEVDVQKGSNAGTILERKRDGVRPGASRKIEEDATRVALFVPDDARPILESIIEEYKSGPLTAKGHPPRKADVEPIEAIRQARLETFWTDDVTALPAQADDEIWWEVWCYKGMDSKVAAAAEKLGAVLSERHYWLNFPENTVIPIFTDRVSIELLLFATVGIAELRRASATPVFFLETEREDQYGWAENLAERTIWPGGDAPAVCLLDTGVNRAHLLLEPALSTDDLMSINTEWGAADEPEGHGTGMAGLALHGDLITRLVDQSEETLLHRLESVKILPPAGFQTNDPKSYGSITQAAASIAEINKPDRRRVFCLSVTNDNVSGSRSSTWSAAIDQAAVGKMAADDDDAPKRLFVVSAGNAPAEIDLGRLRPPDEYPIEDPAQAWNALTVGGYTNKTEIDDPGYEDWQPLAEAGGLSPFTRTSMTWNQSRSPFKPEIVMEAGNRGVNPQRTEALSLDSLALLTSGEDVDRQPLAPFAATSAAAAQAARLAARLAAAHPDLWPETIRALIIHSAEWTPSMNRQIEHAGGLTARSELLRRFGYGVPDFERATASANNHLAIIAQNEIVPFKVDGSRKFKDCHYYRLPLPKDILENLGEQEIRLKYTLSYFIEPNPGTYSAVDPQRYQSFGLRFDLKRRLESERDFIQRMNPLERDNPRDPAPGGGDNSGWKFGSNSVSAGSLHCDEWIGPAIQLAARDLVCIKPVMGWWRSRGTPDECRRTARYALVITLSAPEIDIDLHTPIKIIVDSDINIDIGF